MNQTNTKLSITGIREIASNQFANDGELEIDANAPVKITAGVAKVGCWVWVSNDVANIDNNKDHSDTEREGLYQTAAHRLSTPADFDADIRTSLGDEEGSYVFGWVTPDLGDQSLIANPIELIDGSEEDIDKWFNAADHYCQKHHGHPAMELLDNMDDACDHLRDFFMDGVDPEMAVRKLFRIQAELLWNQLGNVHVNSSDEIRSEFKTPVLVFEKGTDVSTIWHWFEQRYNLSIAEDLMFANKETA